MSKDTPTKASAPAADAPKPDLVRVRVVSKRPLYEHGIKPPGTEFETTRERAARLGKHVEILT
jgi:hypothetical protein